MADVRILVVDDEEIVCRSCVNVLTSEGYRVDWTVRPREGLNLVAQQPYDVILLDLRMPEIDGLELLRRVKEICPDCQVVMMTGYADVATAVEAMKLGAFDYVPKPITPDQLAVIVGRALETRDLVSENRYLRRELQAKYRFENIVGESPAMQAVYELVARVAPTQATVLIQGESGTGKELIARAIHYNSPRKDRRFVAVNCAALQDNLLESELFGHVRGAFTGAVTARKGLFEVADGGTLFLDEIAETSFSLQSKLLRVLQERVYTPVGSTEERRTDVRLIAASNKDLSALVSTGRFREDLFYRLNIVTIHVPPLRERREDIPALALHFLQKYRNESRVRVTDIAPEAMALLVDYDWPGNVRQLENVIRRCLILAQSPTIGPDVLPPELKPAVAPALPCTVPRTAEELKRHKKWLRSKAVEEVERQFVLEALRRNNGVVSRAARDVGMQRPNFQALMRKYGIRAQQFATLEPADGSAVDEPSQPRRPDQPDAE